VVVFRHIPTFSDATIRFLVQNKLRLDHDLKKILPWYSVHPKCTKQCSALYM